MDRTQHLLREPRETRGLPGSGGLGKAALSGVTGAEAWVKGSQRCRWERGQGRGSQAEEERG